jgi:hypothetical protein
MIMLIEVKPKYMKVEKLSGLTLFHIRVLADNLFCAGALVRALMTLPLLQRG